MIKNREKKFTVKNFVTQVYQDFEHVQQVTGVQLTNRNSSLQLPCNSVLPMPSQISGMNENQIIHTQGSNGELLLAPSSGSIAIIHPVVQQGFQNKVSISPM